MNPENLFSSFKKRLIFNLEIIILFNNFGKFILLLAPENNGWRYT